MLPRKVPSIAGLEMAARYTPSFELGGDFYDFIDLNGHLGVVVGDVVGKGIAAALLMSSVRSSLRAHVQEVYDLDEVVSRVNMALCQDTRDNEFASLWYGVINPQTLRLTYCSAGHEPPLVIRPPKGRPAGPADITELFVGGMVVGIDPTQTYQRAVYDLRPGDLVIAYTDGLVDATNFATARFGKARVRAAVLNAVNEIPGCTAAQMVERILWEVRQFAGLSPRPDDLTLLAVRVS
jgi:sigma-B regulation protein RsbU (phosphoserine phosphatase)